MTDRKAMLPKWIKRIVLAILAILLLVVLLFSGTIVFDSLFGSDTADYANVSYTDAVGQELLGYLASFHCDLN